MSKPQRKHYTPQEKVAILRRHLLDQVPVSKLCEEYAISVANFYNWQKVFFENGAVAFENGRRSKVVEQGKDSRIAYLERKLAQKNEVVAELMEDHVKLKKELGDL